MKAIDFLLQFHKVAPFPTKEGKKVGPASSSEIRRWIKNKAVLFCGQEVDIDEEIDFPITSLVIFPNSKQAKITLW